MLFPVHLHTVSSLWSTMWSKIHSHMLCSLLTSRAITAQSTTWLSGLFSLQNWSWGYCEGGLAPGHSHSPFTAKRSLFHAQTHTPNQKNRGLTSHQQCAYMQKTKKISSDKAFYMRWRKIMHSNKQTQAWQTTLFLSCSSSCPILASSHKHIRGAVKVQLG